MANLKEEAKWEEGIYQYELDDPLQGGEDGIDNVQGRQLANRTLYLKEGLEKHSSAENPHKITAEQLGVYTAQQIDERVAALNKAIEGNSVPISALVDESKCRNLLDVLGIRAAHSDEPATLEEVKKAMDILHKKINADGSPDFSGLRIGDYLDLPELDIVFTRFPELLKWNHEYKNLRIMIAAFNWYHNERYIGEKDGIMKNHIVFTFRNCLGYIKGEKYLEIEKLLAKSLTKILGDVLCPIKRYNYYEGRNKNSAEKEVFFPYIAEVFGVSSIFHGFDYEGDQYPLFRFSCTYRKKYNNGSVTNWITASNFPGSYDKICIVTRSGSISGRPLTNTLSGVSPVFCVA